MAYSRTIWNQLKGLTVKEIAKALKKDGWTQERVAVQRSGSSRPLPTALESDIASCCTCTRVEASGPVCCKDFLMTSGGRKTTWSD